MPDDLDEFRGWGNAKPANDLAEFKDWGSKPAFPDQERRMNEARQWAVQSGGGSSPIDKVFGAIGIDSNKQGPLGIRPRDIPMPFQGAITSIGRAITGQESPEQLKKKAEEAFAKGEATDEQLARLAIYEYEANRSRQIGSAGRIAQGVAQAPAVVAETLAAGQAVRGIGAAAGVGQMLPTAGRLGQIAANPLAQNIATQVAATPLTPSLWLKEAEKRQAENGGSLLSPQNAGLPMFRAAFTNAIMGHLGKLGEGKNIVKRAGIGAALMPAEQAAADLIAGAAEDVMVKAGMDEKFKTETGYGTLGMLVSGKRGEVWEKIATEAILGGLATAMHGGQAKPIEKLMDAANSLKKDGLSENQAAKVIQESLSQPLENVPEGPVRDFVEATQKAQEPPKTQSEAVSPETAKPASKPVKSPEAANSGLLDVRKLFDEKHNGDMKSLASDVVNRVQSHLDSGGKVTAWYEGRPIEMVGVKDGMMQDAKGQRWGMMALMQPTKGVKAGIEFKPVERASGTAPQEPIEAVERRILEGTGPEGTERRRPEGLKLGQAEPITMDNARISEVPDLEKFGKDHFRIAINDSAGAKVGELRLGAVGDTLYAPVGFADGLEFGKGRGEAQPFGAKEIKSLVEQVAMLDPEAKKLVFTPSKGRIRAGVEKEFDLTKIRERMAKREESANAEQPASPEKPAEPVQPDAGRPLSPAEKQVGQIKGGAPDSVPPVDTAPPRETALANAKVDAERVENSLPPIVSEARKVNAEVWDQAVGKLEKDPNLSARLTDELANKSRATTVEENALLLHRKIRLNNEYERVIRQANDAMMKGDVSEFGRLSSHADEVLGQIDKLDKVARTTGTEWGQAGQFRRQLAAEDFSLGRMMMEATRQKRSPLTPEEQQKITDLSNEITRLNKIIADLEAMGSTGKIAAKPKIDGLDLAGARVAEKRKRGEYSDILSTFKRSHQSPIQRFADSIKEVNNVRRALITAYDLSAVLRQGAQLTLAHPLKATKAFKEMLKSAASKDYYERAEMELRERPNGRFGNYDRAGLYLADDTGPMTKQEESFMGRFVGKIPGVAASARAYNAYLNRIRADVFDALVDTLPRDGKPTHQDMKDIANYINAATGRGVLRPKLDNYLTPLSDVFFSPRYLVSRMQILSGQPFFGAGSWRTRKIIAKEYAKSIAGLALIYGVAKAFGNELESDSRSADYGKIKTGRTRLDPLAGLSQLVVLGRRLLFGETKPTETGKVQDLRGKGHKFGTDTAGDKAVRFTRNKLAPLAGDVSDTLFPEYAPPGTGMLTDLAGKPGGAKGWAIRQADKVMPISFNDIYDAMKEQGFQKGSAISILSLLGMGQQLHDHEHKKK